MESRPLVLYTKQGIANVAEKQHKAPSDMSLAKAQSQELTPKKFDFASTLNKTLFFPTNASKITNPLA
ncbi:hypothetical protein H5410_018781 [Solanum commersonii]|uniref:Uncharacterized protein n=1 Tax=Solanum commersonii TaxID=4109 RepID=A0A9J6A314_SOLCO|nr:hypothetical protein H5410_018781 [Solanum commersonii]